MILFIEDYKTIEDIQDKFSLFFPFLKIEFYKHPHHWYESSEAKECLPPYMLIGDIRKHHQHGELEIFSWFKTGDIEQEFHKKFNLNVQVFRQHGNYWVQTSGTDKLTLKEQNELGRQASLAQSPGEKSKIEN